jgi:hypothetical protein
LKISFKIHFNCPFVAGFLNLSTIHTHTHTGSPLLLQSLLHLATWDTVAVHAYLHV